MKVQLRVRFVDDADTQDVSSMIELADEVSIEGLGLSLADGKALLSWVQRLVVQRQVAARNCAQAACPRCGKPRSVKDHHSVTYRSLFGKVSARVTRWMPCAGCGRGAAPAPSGQRWVAAELLYVQARLAATLPYARCFEILDLLLPSGAAAAPSTVRQRALGAGQRLDVQGLAARPTDAVVRAGAATKVCIGMDGGYVRHCHPGRCHTRYRKHGAADFEVVAGRLLGHGATRSVAFVRSADPHSERRVRALVAPYAQSLEIFTDGDVLLRSWQESTAPKQTHILDWYHLRRRVDNLDRLLHRREVGQQLRPRVHDRLSMLDRNLQWRLWHGRGLEVMRRLRIMLLILDRRSIRGKAMAVALRKAIVELHEYLQNNADSLPHYAERWRQGQRISSAFAESAVNQIIDKRMSKSQQMRWDPRSAHELLQVRVRLLDGQLRADFQNWYPGMPSNEPTWRLAAA